MEREKIHSNLKGNIILYGIEGLFKTAFNCFVFFINEDKMRSRLLGEK